MHYICYCIKSFLGTQIVLLNEFEKVQVHWMLMYEFEKSLPVITVQPLQVVGETRHVSGLSRIHLFCNETPVDHCNDCDVQCHAAFYDW